MAVFMGTVGADSIVGTSVGDEITGLAGNDTIRPGDGADIVAAGEGDDTVVVNTGDVDPGETLDGGPGIDTLFADSTVNLTGGTITGFERLLIDSLATVTLSASQISVFAEILGTTSTARTVLGAAPGLFDLRGVNLAANITFEGSAGNDTIFGSIRGERIDAGDGADNVRAGGGDDTVVVNTDDVDPGELLDGGLGVDTLFADSTVNLAAGRIAGFERLVIDSGAVVTLSAAQIRTFQEIAGNTNTDRTVVGAAPGTFDLRGVTLGTRVTFEGSGGADIILGSIRAERIDAGDGADNVRAGGGDDTVVVNTGDVDPGEILNGGIGVDTLFADSTVNISLGTLLGFERLLIDSGAEVTLTDAQLAAFAEVAGDTSTARALVAARPGLYDLTGKAASNAFQLTGSTGADTLIGGARNDTLLGGGGSDRLSGGNGADRLTGGLNDDVFVLVASEAQGDQITDFTGAGVLGGDRLELRGYGAGAQLEFLGGTSYQVVVSGLVIDRFSIVSGGVALTAGDYAFF